MKMHDTRQIAASQEAVWAALFTPEVLKACIPGCTAFDGSVEEGFEATITQKVGPVKATFKGSIVLDGIEPPSAVRITGEGKGGAAGFGKGGAQIRLSPAPNGTELHYEVEARIGGKLAQLGGRIIDSFAKKMADQFFERLSGQLGGAPQGDTAKEATP